MPLEEELEGAPEDYAPIPEECDLDENWRRPCFFILGPCKASSDCPCTTVGWPWHHGCYSYVESDGNLNTRNRYAMHLCYHPSHAGYMSRQQAMNIAFSADTKIGVLFQTYKERVEQRETWPIDGWEPEYRRAAATNQQDIEEERSTTGATKAETASNDEDEDCVSTDSETGWDGIRALAAQYAPRPLTNQGEASKGQGKRNGNDKGKGKSNCLTPRGKGFGYVKHGYRGPPLPKPRHVAFNPEPIDQVVVRRDDRRKPQGRDVRQAITVVDELRNVMRKQFERHVEEALCVQAQHEKACLGLAAAFEQLP